MGKPDDSRARASHACLGCGRPPHTPVMASSLMRKLRKTGGRRSGRQRRNHPRLPSVADSNKPPGWNRWVRRRRLSISLASASTACTSTFPGVPTTSIRTGLPLRRRSSASLRWSPLNSGVKLPASASDNALSQR